MSVAFDPRARLVYIRVGLTGPAGVATGLFALDTGATRTGVSEPMLRRIGYDVSNAPRPHRAAAAGGNLSAGLLTVDRLTALDRTLHRPTIMFHHLNPSARVHGILGLDFFRGYVLTIDFTRGRIDLRPPRPWWRFWR